MQIFIFITLCLVIFNSIMLIAIASAISKFLPKNQDDDDIISDKKEDKLLDLPVVQSYDNNVLNGGREPYTDGVERRLMTIRNWDGVKEIDS